MGRRRKLFGKANQRDAEAVLIGAVIIAGGAIWLLSNIIEFFQQNIGALYFLSASAVLYLVFHFYSNHKEFKRTQETKEKIDSEIAKVNISDDRHDYIIKDSNYKRGNPIERAYKKKYFLHLLDLFDNKCAKCHSKQNGVNLDHFFMSKNSGGNFSLLHKDGYLVNNAIPLCKSCNMSKSDRDYKDFFTKSELLTILELNAEMTKYINEHWNKKKLG